MDDAPTNAARLIAPRLALRGCIFAAIVRDTRGLVLSESDRFNFFPASPLCAVSWFFEGASHIVSVEMPEPAPDSAALPPLNVAGPQTKPLVSWNPGPVFAMTIGFYPDAWRLLAGQSAEALIDWTLPIEEAVNEPLALLFRAVLSGIGSAEARLAAFEDSLEPLWRSVRPDGDSTAHRLQDWTRSVASRAALSRFGQSSRQIQRRIKSWTGMSRRSLDGFANVEALFERATRTKDPDLAGLAAEHGFADQSHMGREVRRVTGLSPARLNHLIRTNEAFWCYRLFGERF